MKANLVFKRVMQFLAIFALFVFVALLGALTIIFYGPSNTARDLLVVSLNETSAGKPIARMYFSQEKINEIIAKNTVRSSGTTTDVSLIKIPEKDNTTYKSNDIKIVKISGSTYNGTMMVVKDPSLVYLGTLDSYGEDSVGLTLMDMIKRDNAVGGINAGGFLDNAGMGNGGVPLGLVIKDGKVMYGDSSDAKYEIVGIDNSNKLVLGTMTASEAIAGGIKDAMSFGPLLIVNGESVNVRGTGGGLNPRTAIGQTADGTMLLLVIDGRQPTSLGATFRDIIEIMYEFGAVNAANLDGGSSTLMVYDNEILNSSASLYGPRQIPTAFLVRGAGDE